MRFAIRKKYNIKVNSYEQINRLAAGKEIHAGELDGIEYFSSMETKYIIKAMAQTMAPMTSAMPGTASFMLRQPLSIYMRMGDAGR